MESAVVPVDIFCRFGAALLIGKLVGLLHESAHLQKAQEHEEPSPDGD